MRSKSKLMIVMCIMIAVMAVGYGAFSTVLNITGTASITSEWKVVFSNITEQSKTNGVSIKTQPSASGTTATFDVGLTSPGDKIVYKITLANQGTLDAIVTDIVATATDSPAIIFSVTGINIGDTLTQKASKELTVTIEYDSNVTEQPEKLAKTLTVNIVTEQKINQSIDSSTPNVQQPMYLSTLILRDNVAQADTNIDFSKSNDGCHYDNGQALCGELDSNGKGLYYTNINTENNGTTHYFRGSVENNYVKFGTYKTEIYYGYSDSTNLTQYIAYDSLDSCKTGLYGSYNVNCTKIRDIGDPLLWRIVRINEDGSVRLVTQDVIGSTIFNEERYDNADVGYMYGSIGQSGDNAYALTHANDNPSTIKTYLDNWYVSNLLSYSGYIADSGFCNDRSIASSAGLWFSNDTALGYGQNTTYYGALNRIINEKQPQFACPNPTNDLFTTSTSIKGNKALTYPIGLLTNDEVAYAGGGRHSHNDTNMYLVSRTYFWTMSPMDWMDGFTSFYVTMGDSTNTSGDAGNKNGVRPVINLKSMVEVSTELPEGCTKLDGTELCPYIVKTN